MEPLTIAYIVIALTALWAVWSYNGFVRMKTRVHEGLSDIDVQLKRRYDLIPNLIESVRGYMTYESSLLERVTEARAKVAHGGTALERAGAEAALSGTLKTLFAVAEGYPELKANANFLSLQGDLTDTENKIQAARRFYNSMVMALNASVSSFPGNLVASSFGFGAEKFFEAANDAEREPVRVRF